MSRAILLVQMGALLMQRATVPSAKRAISTHRRLLGFARLAAEEEINAIVSAARIPSLRPSLPRGSHVAIHSIHRGPSAPVPPQLSKPSATKGAISGGISRAAVDKLRFILDQRFNKEGVEVSSETPHLAQLLQKRCTSNNNSLCRFVCLPLSHNFSRRNDSHGLSAVLSFN